MQNIRLFEKESDYKSALIEICKSGGGYSQCILSRRWKGSL